MKRYGWINENIWMDKLKDMDGWMDGWMDGRTDRWTGGQTHLHTHQKKQLVELP